MRALSNLGRRTIVFWKAFKNMLLQMTLINTYQEREQAWIQSQKQHQVGMVVQPLLHLVVQNESVRSFYIDLQLILCPLETNKMR
jgi:hypothetical protein